jgi:hypothetical protein
MRDQLDPRSLRFSLAREVQTLTTSKGRIWFWSISPGLYATEVRGHLSVDMARHIVRYAEPLYQQGVLSGFHNWLEMTGYDSQSRVLLTEWVLSHRDQTHLHIGVRSKIVAMGVSVANLALGNLIRTYSSSAAMEAALEKALLASS